MRLVCDESGVRGRVEFAEFSVFMPVGVRTIAEDRTDLGLQRVGSSTVLLAQD